MEELESLKRKIKNAEDLQSVVKIMKTIAASNIREYEKAVESLNEYNKTIEMGLQISLMNRPDEFQTTNSGGRESVWVLWSSVQTRGCAAVSMR